MHLLFVILRMLFGPDCFPTERLEPVTVRANGRASSVHRLPVEDLQLRFGMSWPNLRHVLQESFVDNSPSGDESASPRWCFRTCLPRAKTLLLRRNLRS
ncbi:MAG: hypothetical protein CMJ64_05190 [Planctomycetaceae bacterium]|nr:hypothetical protein [Planctomycetaceae bacterium]